LALTPAATANRPALGKLAYRVGAHATFLQTMQARLSAKSLPALEGLRTREGSDPSLALLDAWATVADVLTFYQERIANEGYLRTATERRSVLELARLVGYALRPGVAASVYLAYTLDKDSAPVEIPKGALANSIPGPGEQMQPFETSEPLLARFEWNVLKPRLTRPQIAADIRKSEIYFKGTANRLKANDLLCIVEAGIPRVVRVNAVALDSANDRTRVELRTGVAALDLSGVHALVERFGKVEQFDVSPDAAMTKRVLGRLQDLAAAAAAGPPTLAAFVRSAVAETERDAQEAHERQYSRLEPWVGELLGALRGLERLPASAEPAILSGDAILELEKQPFVQLANAKQLPRTASGLLAPGSDVAPRLLTALKPMLAETLYPYLQNLPPSAVPRLEVYAFRVVAAPFGHNAPPRLLSINEGVPKTGEWEIDDPLNLQGHGRDPGPDGKQGGNGRSEPDHHEPNKLYLDNDYDIAPDSFFVIATPDREDPIITRATKIVHRALAAYGLAGKTVEVSLPQDRKWLSDPSDFAPVRGTRIYTGSERLELADVPIAESIGGVASTLIELDGIYQGLEAGRWLIVTGERTDITPVSGQVVPGVRGTELVMIAAVKQDQRKNQENGRAVPLAGEKLHTFITLAEKGLAYKYKRDTVTIYGNVVKATHGETRREVLGGGDGAKAFQTFTLKQSPLTFVSAPTVSGVESTLEVRVNDVQWHEAEMLAALGPTARSYLTRTDDDAKTSIVFGDGVHGARPATGAENIRATYRSGIGEPGNVRSGQISLLGTRPLGVKEVTNPIRASGGANRESRDQARKNAPLALMALDRLVSVADYAFFARTFAGIGKAVAYRVTDGHQHVVRLALAGVNDIPIEPTSDLYRNLYAALHRFGDPFLPIELVIRKRLALVISANIKIDPDYLWEALEPKIRAALLARFGFEGMELGQDVLLSDATAAIQAVRGVVYVDIDVFDRLSEAELRERFTQQDALKLKRLDRIPIGQAQIAYLSPDVADTLILQEIKS
jgi:hypothetical protein